MTQNYTPDTLFGSWQDSYTSRPCNIALGYQVIGSLGSLRRTDLMLILKLSVRSRPQDSYIQLKSFKGEPGKRFSIAIALGDVSVKEEFEL